LGKSQRIRGVRAKGGSDTGSESGRKGRRRKDKRIRFEKKRQGEKIGEVKGNNVKKKQRQEKKRTTGVSIKEAHYLKSLYEKFPIELGQF